VTGLLLTVLAIAWLTVFLPAALRAREGTPLASAEKFRRRMQLIAPRTPRGRWVLVPESPDRLAASAFRPGQRRRKHILVFLLASTAISLLPALVAGRGMWEVQFAFDASLILYVFLLIKVRRRHQTPHPPWESEGEPEVKTEAHPEHVRFYEPVKRPISLEGGAADGQEEPAFP
jgi:hypothetical protein